MKNISLKILMVFVGFTLAGCSTFSNVSAPQRQAEPSGPRDSQSNRIESTGANHLENTLDKYDQEKMSHALDKPLNQATSWANPKTGTGYTVTPIAKLTFNGNPYCRKYSLVSSKGGAKNESQGTACVSATDSSWQIVN